MRASRVGVFAFVLALCLVAAGVSVSGAGSLRARLQSGVLQAAESHGVNTEFDKAYYDVRERDINPTGPKSTSGRFAKLPAFAKEDPQCNLAASFKTAYFSRSCYLQSRSTKPWRLCKGKVGDGVASCEQSQVFASEPFPAPSPPSVKPSQTFGTEDWSCSQEVNFRTSYYSKACYTSTSGKAPWRICVGFRNNGGFSCEATQITRSEGSIDSKNDPKPIPPPTQSFGTEDSLCSKEANFVTAYYSKTCYTEYQGTKPWRLCVGYLNNGGYSCEATQTKNGSGSINARNAPPPVPQPTREFVKDDSSCSNPVSFKTSTYSKYCFDSTRGTKPWRRCVGLVGNGGFSCQANP